LNVPGSKHLKLESDKLFSSFAFSFNLSRYNKASNDRLRVSARSQQLQHLAPFVPIVRFLQSALLKLPAPAEPEMVFRGLKVSTAGLDMTYQKGQEFQWGQFTSCSRQSDNVKSFGTRTVFAVRCFGGRHVQQFSRRPEEDEVVLPIGARLRVMGCSNDGTMIHLEEVRSAAAPFPFPPAAAAVPGAPAAP